MDFVSQTNTFQMAVLLQFNEQVKWTFQQLLENTGLMTKTILLGRKSEEFFFHFKGMSQENLQQILGILFKVHLLECDVNEEQLLPDTEVSLNNLFKR